MEIQTHHRLVNTTPNPRATKKSKGELVGLLLRSPGGVVVEAGGLVEVADGAAILAHSVAAVCD